MREQTVALDELGCLVTHQVPLRLLVAVLTQDAQETHPCQVRAWESGRCPAPDPSCRLRRIGVESNRPQCKLGSGTGRGTMSRINAFVMGTITSRSTLRGVLAFLL